MIFKILRECECGRIRRLGQQRADTVRRYCRVCGEVSEWTKRDQTADVTDIQRHQLRCHHSQVMVGAHKGRVSKMHLPDGDGTICGHDHETMQKDIAVYPRGFKDWCSNCLHNESHPDLLAVRETVREALQECEDSELGPLNYYRLRDFEPTLYVIQEWFGDWSQALHELDLVDEHPEPQNAHL